MAKKQKIGVPGEQSFSYGSRREEGLVFRRPERGCPARDSVERPRLANLSAVSPFVRLAVIVPKSDRLRRARCPAPLSPARGTQILEFNSLPLALPQTVAFMLSSW